MGLGGDAGDLSVEFCYIRYIQLGQIAEYGNDAGEAIEGAISRNNIARLPPLSEPKYISISLGVRVCLLAVIV